MSTTKRDFAVKIADATGMTQANVAAIIQKILDCLTHGIASGKTIELRNFGVFEVVVRKARVGRNPKNPKKDVVIPERVQVKFRAGKELNERLAKLKIKQLRSKKC
ncbi:MAG: integration host factor subunit beta [Lentisphaerae bacterium GWF2_45_14]|nr:MAG: integration host factor subunit beta [Lentisphaerae bacterium GWF2_45_14]